MVAAIATFIGEPGNGCGEPPDLGQKFKESLPILLL